MRRDCFEPPDLFRRGGAAGNEISTRALPAHFGAMQQWRAPSRRARASRVGSVMSRCHHPFVSKSPAVPALDVDGRLIQQPCHQFIDMPSDAGFGQRIADELARALKLDAFRQLKSCSDPLGLSGGSSEIVMKLLGGVEAGDRQREHNFVEIAGTPLSTGLQRSDARSRRFTIEDRAKLRRLRFTRGAAKYSL